MAGRPRIAHPRHVHYEPVRAFTIWIPAFTCTDEHANSVKALRLLNSASDLMNAVQVAMRFEATILASSSSEVRLL